MYYSSLTRKVTNLFTLICIQQFWATNTLNNNLHNKEPEDMNNTSGIYKLTCKTCNYSFIGQTGIFPIVRCQEQVTYITTNNPNSAYALYNLNNRHEEGSMETTELLKTCTKGSKRNCFLYKPTSNGANWLKGIRSMIQPHGH
jgi:hypothetical protein